jgi:HEAT repeat protein
MAVTMEQVRKELEKDEPNYARAAKLGAAALPHLDKLVTSDDPAIASKAASLAGMIRDAKAAPVLEKAAQSKDPRVRVAAAHAAQHLGEGGEKVLLKLVADKDLGVQKVALRSVPDAASPALKKKVEGVSKQGDPAIRPVAADVLERL